MAAIVGYLAGWIVVSAVVGLVVGRLIHQKDELWDRLVEAEANRAAWIEQGRKVEASTNELLVARMLEQMNETKPLVSDQQWAEVLSRVLDTALPKRDTEGPPLEDGPTHDPEYDPPYEPVPDWTDAFIGEERPDFMGVPAGGGVPTEQFGGVIERRGDGSDSYDFAPGWLDPPPLPDEMLVGEGDGVQSWVEPVSLDDDTRVE